MSHLDKDYQQQQEEPSLGHEYTHKKFNRVYSHKKLGLCLRQREQENKENRLEHVREHKPSKTLFRPYDLGANTPRRRRNSRFLESNQSQSSSQSRKSAEEYCMPTTSAVQSTPLSLVTPKQHSTLSTYTQQSSTRFCDFVKENYPPNTCTPPPSSSSSSCDSTEENYAPQSPASSCESLKENDNTSMYTPQSSPLSCGSTEENYTPAIHSPQYSPQSHEPAKQNCTPQSSEFAEENSTSSRCSRQSSSRSCQPNREIHTPPVYPPHSSSSQHYAAEVNSPQAIEHGNMPAESYNSYIFRLQRQRASLYMHYLSQYQQLPAVSLQTAMGYPMGYPNVTAPIFNGY